MNTSMDALFGRPAKGPLSGLVIADLSRVLAGPYATMLLADLGALVIKIESPKGDDTRSWLPPERDGVGTYYLSVNRNKYSIALDFSNPDDLETVKEIVSHADVLVENFKSGGLARFGLDYASIRSWHPDIIYASITGFGSAGGADLPGYDLIAQAVSGMMDLTGQAEGEPTKVGVALVDVVTGLHALTGILAALYARTYTSEGQHVETNLLSSALSGLVNQSGTYVASGISPKRMGNAHPSLYPYEPFPTRDKDLVIAVGNDEQFVRLCAVLELPALAAQSAHNVERPALRAVASPPAMTWFDLLRAAAVPAAPILSVAEGIELASTLGLSPIQLAGTGPTSVPTVRHPVLYSGFELEYLQAPPALNADQTTIVSWLRDLKASGAAGIPSPR